ncbi:MAG TPA: DUF2079 domain-containing protein [Beutenbergiaceae bacterium]|nr:DUF2079 domain-containing protein [Beutenbergiaceae bacterium]
MSSAPSAPARVISAVGSWAGRHRAALVLTAAVTAVYTLFSWRQWARFEVPSWDLGIFTQLMRAYAELRAPVVPIKGEGFMLLGDHFHPLLAVFAPFYAIWPSGFTLLVAQAVCVGISAGIVTACGVRHLGRWPGVAIGAAYGLSWGIQSAVASQFHEVALALPVLAASLSALVRRRHLAAALWSLPLLGIKEDLGLTVAVIGVVIAIRGSRRLGLGLAALGVAAFWVTTSLVLPALNPDGIWDYAQDSIVAQLFADPVAALAGLGAGVTNKLVLVLAVFAITLFAALASPLALITLPTLAWRLTSEVPFHWGTEWHYSAVLMVVVFIAAIDALHTRRGAVPLARPAAAVIAGVAVVVSAWFPLSALTQWATYSPAIQQQGAQAALEAIEDDAVVVSDITLLAYLAPRAEVYWLNSPGAPVPDYLVVDQASGGYGANPPRDVVQYATELFGEHGWVEVVNHQGFMVAARE